jgi:succinyl-CoA synthetase beta subunit
VNIHEYQAKEVFAGYGIPIVAGKVATTAEEAKKIASEAGGPVVVKAQVHAGGRGKAGGVKLAQNPDEAREKAEAILKLSIKGYPVRKVLVVPAAEIAKEYYLGVTMDRGAKRPVIIASAAGGVDIEEVARTTPEKIHRYHLTRRGAFRSYEARAVTLKIEPRKEIALKMARVLERLVEVFWASDASLVEINPLITTPDDKVIALDAKMVIDDNALYRQPRLASYREDESEDAAAAREMGLSFVPLEGNVGCVVNGAGLAMATMDLIKHYGGEPANFLDIGGSSNPDKVTTAMRIILDDPQVKAVLFNIFGGITRCDDVAQGILAALKNLDVRVPVVVRLTGTNEEIAREMLARAEGVEPAATMDDVVKTALARADGARRI